MPDSSTVFAVLLEDAVTRDRTTARRFELAKILLQERYLTREQLIARVEGKLGRDCFGNSAWEDTFYRDIQVVKRALGAAGYQPTYSRSPQQPGYYLRNQPAVGTKLAAILEGCIAEVNPVQISILKQLSIQQRFLLGCSTSNIAVQVVAHRTRLRTPQLSPAEAQRQAIQKGSSQ